MTNENGKATAPSGFWIALPDGWVSLDVNPATSATTARQLVEAAARNDNTVRENRVAIEQMLAQLASDAAATGVQFCACYFQVFEEDFHVQASLTVAILTLDEANDPGAMVRELAGGGAGRSVEVVEVEAGPAVRRTGRRREALPGMEEPLEFLGCQYYVPVPSTTNQIALLSFVTPTLAVEEDMDDLFDSMARTFTFTWAAQAPA
jgi:hypothetical protein